MLGDFDPELDAFVELFARRKTPYIRRSLGGNWQTIHHALARDEVVKHLLADQLPGVPAIWIGTRAWERTMHAAIDVDFRGDTKDYKQRCQHAEEILLSLGIPENRMLICPSPSGGRHYRIFFQRPVFTDYLPIVFGMAGLPLAPGQFEVFPSETKGLRLPFGHIPGQPHDPMEWVRFIRDYGSKVVSRVNWDQLVKRAQTLYQRQPITPSEQAATKSASPVRKELPSVGLGMPKRNRLDASGSSAHVANNHQAARVNQSRTKTVAAARIEQIWNQGITKKGTRVGLTKQLAWHLILVDRLSVEEATRRLVEWVYSTGRCTSKDVQADLARGSRMVEQQTAEIVRWFKKRREEDGVFPVYRFATGEIGHIIKAVEALPTELRLVRARFMIDFLNVAKRCGSKSENGFECRPSVDGIIKKWKNCKGGTKYKSHLDWSIQAGLIRMTKEKSQRAHRPRTYVVVVPHVSIQECSLTYRDVLNHIGCVLSQDDVQPSDAPSQVSAVGYKELVPRGTEGDWNQAGDRSREELEGEKDSLRRSSEMDHLGPTTIPDIKPLEAGLNHVDADHGKPTVESSISTSCSSRQASCRGIFPQPEYKECTGTDLAEGSSAGTGREQAVQGLGYRPTGPLHSLCQGHPFSSGDKLPSGCPLSPDQLWL